MSETIASSVLAVGLRNAHAMEREMRGVLERQLARFDDYPEMQAMIRRHLDETESQIERLADCLETVGESLSGARRSGSIPREATGMMAQNEVLASTFAGYALENYEIATYQSLLELAQLAGKRQIEPYLRASMAEEEAFAQWIGQNIARLTRDYVNQMERKGEAGKAPR
jgi:ferritin-like metal-binding protein YciE